MTDRENVCKLVQLEMDPPWSKEVQPDYMNALKTQHQQQYVKGSEDWMTDPAQGSTLEVAEVNHRCSGDVSFASVQMRIFERVFVFCWKVLRRPVSAGPRYPAEVEPTLFPGFCHRSTPFVLTGHPHADHQNHVFRTVVTSVTCLCCRKATCSSSVCQSGGGGRNSR